MSLTVVYDACVLYPAPLRDFLMHLALIDLYSAKWTDAIHDEWIRNVLRDRSDLTREQLERTRNLMNIHVRDCLVSGYESLIPNLTLPDPDDRHVLAAAIHTNASIIVTFNLRDFPDSSLRLYGVEAQHPDQFVVRLLDSTPQPVCFAMRRHQLSLKRPAKSVDDYLATLDAQGLVQTVVKLHQFADQI